MSIRYTNNVPTNRERTINDLDETGSIRNATVRGARDTLCGRNGTLLDLTTRNHYLSSNTTGTLIFADWHFAQWLARQSGIVNYLPRRCLARTGISEKVQAIFESGQLVLFHFLDLIQWFYYVPIVVERGRNDEGIAT